VPALQGNQGHQREYSGKRRESRAIKRRDRLRDTGCTGNQIQNRSRRAIELQRAHEARRAGEGVAGKRRDRKRDRRIRRQATAETYDMKRRVDAFERSDVASGLVGEL